MTIFQDFFTVLPQIIGYYSSTAWNLESGIFSSCAEFQELHLLSLRYYKIPRGFRDIPCFLRSLDDFPL